MKLSTILRQSVVRRHLWIALTIGLFVAILQPYAIGYIYSSAEARELLYALQNPSLFFGSAVATSSATILALMLTILSLTHNADKQFGKDLYDNIRAAAVISTYTFLGSILLLLTLCLPVGEFKEIPGNWFQYIYYILSLLNGLLAGLMTSIILILRMTVLHIITELSPNTNEENF
ncbi:MAG: hypothetical protein ACK4TA_18100 [Saprospiraceae bacterium]